MVRVTTNDNASRLQRFALFILHISVMVGAVVLILAISFDTFRNISFVSDPQYLQIQFWVCILFLIDIVAEFVLSPRKWHYIATNIVFLLIVIPYLNILTWAGVNISGELAYVLRLLPMLRAAYVLAIITGAFSGKGIESMFAAYIMLLTVVVYFSSLMFFVEEHGINPDVTDYGQSLWWSVMCMTTTGCYIGEYTVTGKVLSTVLSASGLILFPVFTIYITQAIANSKQT